MFLAELNIGLDPPHELFCQVQQDRPTPGAPLSPLPPLSPLLASLVQGAPLC